MRAHAATCPTPCRVRPPAPRRSRPADPRSPTNPAREAGPHGARRKLASAEPRGSRAKTRPRGADERGQLQGLAPGARAGVEPAGRRGDADRLKDELRADVLDLDLARLVASRLGRHRCPASSLTAPEVWGSRATPSRGRQIPRKPRPGSSVWSREPEGGPRQERLAKRRRVAAGAFAPQPWGAQRVSIRAQDPGLLARHRRGSRAGRRPALARKGASPGRIGREPREPPDSLGADPIRGGAPSRAGSARRVDQLPVEAPVARAQPPVAAKERVDPRGRPGSCASADEAPRISRRVRCWLPARLTDGAGARRRSARLRTGGG